MTTIVATPWREAAKKAGMPSTTGETMPSLQPSINCLAALLLGNLSPCSRELILPRKRLGQSTKSPKGIDHDSHVDRLLQECAPDRLDEPRCGNDHAGDGQAQADEDALQRDPASRLGDAHRKGEGLQPIHHHNDGRGLR